MPYHLTTDFPKRLSDHELDSVPTSILRHRYGQDVQTWLPELQLALVMVAISEQSRRQLARSSRNANIGLIIAGTALFVALVTLLIQLV